MSWSHIPVPYNSASATGVGGGGSSPRVSVMSDLTMTDAFDDIDGGSGMTSEDVESQQQQKSSNMQQHSHSAQYRQHQIFLFQQHDRQQQYERQLKQQRQQEKQLQQKQQQQQPQLQLQPQHSRHYKKKHRRVKSSSSASGTSSKKNGSSFAAAAAASAEVVVNLPLQKQKQQQAPRRTGSAGAGTLSSSGVASSALEYSLSGSDNDDNDNEDFPFQADDDDDIPQTQQAQQQQQETQQPPPERSNQKPSQSRFRLREDANNINSSFRLFRFRKPPSWSEEDNNLTTTTGQEIRETTPGTTTATPPPPPPPPLGNLTTSSSNTMNTKPNKKERSTTAQYNQQQSQQSQPSFHHAQTQPLHRRAGGGRKQALASHQQQKQQHAQWTPQKQRETADWVTQLAYSFRSPAPAAAAAATNKSNMSSQPRKSKTNTIKPSNPSLLLETSQRSSEHVEYPHYPQPQQQPLKQPNQRQQQLRIDRTSDMVCEEKKQQPELLRRSWNTGSSIGRESDPLLFGSSIISRDDEAKRLGVSLIQRIINDDDDDDDDLSRDDDDEDDANKNYIAIAASFLQDYEGGRAPTLSTNLTEITPRQVRLYQLKFGNAHVFSHLLSLATMAIFLSSFLEGFAVPNHIASAVTAASTSATPREHQQHQQDERFTLSTSTTVAAAVTSVQARRTLLTALNFFAIVVFGIDIWFRQQICGPPLSRRRQEQQEEEEEEQKEQDRKKLQQQQTRHDAFYPEYQQHWNDRHTRHSRSERLVKPLIMLGIVLALENFARLLIVKTYDPKNKDIVMFSSVFKPLVLFYVSSKARNALEALRRIIRIVARVLVMELLVILMFAAVACRLFREYTNFKDLSTAWLSLFELATTVVNPSVWMPVYQKIPLSALFFIFFVITSVFYLHSLVLSVVFQTFVHASGAIHDRSVIDREDAIQLAYMALQRQQKRLDYAANDNTYGGFGGGANGNNSHIVDIELVRETLRIIRPHYSPMKINALIEIVDPTNQQAVDLVTFRTKIRQALNASIRTARTPTRLATSIELIAVVVAVVNFVYVMLVSSPFDTAWFNAIQVDLGALITLVAGFELLIRFNPLRIPDFTPLTRLNATFDGIALVAALISCIGIGLYVTEQPRALEYILTGRAVDIFRVMRFFGIFRDVVRRSSDVFPALVGPLVLVITMLHIFVYTGLALWGGAVPVGQQEERYFLGQITYLYDLNNFNSYAEGMVTMFQILVVNDWHAIAQVFLYADRMSSPYIVYPFFILGNLIGVSILLNVLTAFFVQAFVTKVDDGSGLPGSSASAQNGEEAGGLTERDRDYSILMSQHNSLRRITSRGGMGPRASSISNKRSRGVQLAVENSAAIDHGADADSEASSEDLYEFDVFEREGFDKIMQTVAGSGSSQDADFARQVCNYFEVFESLVPGREPVGYLVCDQRTLDRYGNRRFQTKADGFLSEQELNVAVSDMHSELLALSARPTYSNDRSLIRVYPHRNNPSRILEISASLLRRHPAVSLFCSRTKRTAPASAVAASQMSSSARSSSNLANPE